MAFFSLTDIKYVSDSNRTTEFALNNDAFKVFNRRYPIDIGETGKGHYMTFYIRTQERTQVDGYQQGGYRLDSTGGSARVQDSSEVDFFDALQRGARELLGSFGGDTLKSIETQEVSQDLLKRGNFFRTINKTTDSISLYMPDTLNFGYTQSYSDLNVTADLGNVGLGISAAASIYDQRKSGVSNQVKNAAPFAAEFAKNTLGSNGGQTLFSALTAVTGGALAVNPQLELIYQGTGFRSFRFSFMFYPRSQKEAEEVLGIIDSFTFHQAPEVLSSSFGRYLVPPSEFDIKFYCNGQENPNIPKMTNSVLIGVEVDYAPSGFASYETLRNANKPERGGTGMPVAIRMDLSFKETQIITKRFLKGQKEEAYKSSFRVDESNNGLDIGNESSGELRTQAQINASALLDIRLENTATADTEFAAATAANRGISEA